MKMTKLFVLVFFAIHALACQEELESISQVTKFRVLAVQADPPEIRPGQMTTFRVLFADPKGQGRKVTAVWAVLAGLFLPNSDLSGLMNGLDTSGDTDTSGDGTGQMPPVLWVCEPTAAADGGDKCAMPTLEEDILARIPEGENGLTATAIALLCAGGDLPSWETLSDQELGEISSLKDLCVNADGTKGDGLVALKTMKITKADSQSQVLNANPRVDKVVFNGRTIVPQLNDEGSLFAGVYQCKGDDGCRDTFDVETYLTNVGKERHYVSWFVTGGKFVTGDRSGTADSDQLGPYETKWLPPRLGGNFTLWIVAHDVSGGVSWQEVLLFEPINALP